MNQKAIQTCMTHMGFSIGLALSLGATEEDIRAEFEQGLRMMKTMKSTPELQKATEALDNLAVSALVRESRS